MAIRTVEKKAITTPVSTAKEKLFSGEELFTMGEIGQTELVRCLVHAKHVWKHV